MKLKIFDAPVYLHSEGRSIHIDIEHPLFAEIISRGERTFCQGKGEHGVFIALNSEMAKRARRLLEAELERRLQSAWNELNLLSLELGWERVEEFLKSARRGEGSGPGQDE